jgi:hypothetical protein
LCFIISEGNCFLAASIGGGTLLLALARTPFLAADLALSLELTWSEPFFLVLSFFDETPLID